MNEVNESNKWVTRTLDRNQSRNDRKYAKLGDNEKRRRGRPMGSYKPVNEKQEIEDIKRSYKYNAPRNSRTSYKHKHTSTSDETHDDSGSSTEWKLNSNKKYNNQSSSRSNKRVKADKMEQQMTGDEMNENKIDKQVSEENRDYKYMTDDEMFNQPSNKTRSIPIGGKPANRGPNLLMQSTKSAQDNKIKTEKVIEPAKWKGSSNTLGYFTGDNKHYSVDQFLDQVNRARWRSEDEKIGHAISRLKGEADRWWLSFSQSIDQPLDWDKFVTTMTIKFRQF